MSKSLKVSILGMGFVGLVSGACYASRGIQVIGTSLDEKVVNLINSGTAPFYEDGLNELLAKAVEEGNLKAMMDNSKAIQESSISFISVGTPMLEDKSINLTYIKNCSTEIGRALRDKEDYHLVVDRSTIIPGTTRNIIGKNIEKESNKKMGKDFGLCMQPEFLREGNSVHDTFNPNRIIIGEVDQRSGNLLESFWREFYGEMDVPLLRMNLESAEMVKYANNCLLATKISFANELSQICELIPDLDVVEVMKGVGMDDRLNAKFLNAGPGFGGSCFPKDVNAIIDFAKMKNIYTDLLSTVMKVNDNQAIHFVDIVEDLMEDLTDKKITILGLSFKPGTDDMREASSVRIIEELLKRGVKCIVGYDPKALENAKKELGSKIQYATSISEALEGSDCALLLTEWDEFKSLTPDDFKKHMKLPNLVDGRRIYPFKLFSENLNFRVIGRRK